MTETTVMNHREHSLFVRLRRLAESQFFSREVAPQDAVQIIAWWEARRLTYNFLVGAVGAVSCGLCLITGLICERYGYEPIGIPDPLIFAFVGIAAYAVAANLCYTGGWIIELLVRKIWPDHANAFGKISFFLGCVFSMLLTLAPGVLVTTVGALTMVRH